MKIKYITESVILKNEENLEMILQKGITAVHVICKEDKEYTGIVIHIWEYGMSIKNGSDVKTVLYSDIADISYTNDTLIEI